MAMKFGNGVDLDNKRIINVADPSSNTDGANKQYVDGVARGLRWKDSVRAATTANGTLATAYANGQTVDGITLATGDRILLKDQTTQTENGIYIVAASGAPTRAADLAAASDAKGIAVTVTNGTVNNDRVYIQTTDPSVVGTNNLTFSQLGGGGTTYTAGSGLNESPAGTFNVTNTDGSLTVAADTVSVASQLAGAGLTLTSGVLDVVGDASITVAANALGLATGVAGGGLTLTSGVLDVVAGTGITVAANSVSVSSVVVRQYATTIGDNSTTNIVITHNLGTRDVQVTVRNATTPWEQVIVDNEATTTNTVTLRFGTAPTTNQYTAIVQGAA